MRVSLPSFVRKRVCAFVRSCFLVCVSVRESFQARKHMCTLTLTHPRTEAHTRENERVCLRTCVCVCVSAFLCECVWVCVYT